MDKNPQAPAFTFQDDPAVREIYADEAQTIAMYGSMLRIVLTAARPDPPKHSGKTQSGKKVVVGRIVMPPSGLRSLHDHLGQILNHLEKQGLSVALGGRTVQ